MPKKAGAEKCEEHRAISLRTQSTKLLTGIINRRIEQNVEYCLAEDQFGFRNSKGTREAILALRVILAKRIDRNRMAFVDL